MGSNSSKVHSTSEVFHESDSNKFVSVKRSVLDVVKIMLPVYFTREAITEDEIVIARRKWNLIVNDESQHFHKMKGLNGCEVNSCMSLFYDTFYRRLFDIHPECKPMFRSGLKSQGKFLVKMITMTLQLANQDEQFTEVMTKLAQVHNARGVKAIEYGIVGEVLFYSLKACLGPEYDHPTHKAWVKIFSQMLMAIVPVAVTFEMKCGQAQTERLRSAFSAEQAAIKMFESERSDSKPTADMDTQQQSYPSNVLGNSCGDVVAKV